jgi:thiol-disulfide isomerase/thioredoxin
MRNAASRFACSLALVAVVSISLAQTPAPTSAAKPAAPNLGPTDPNAKKSYDDAVKLMKEDRAVFALDGFRKADKLDGGHCVVCELGAWDAAMEAANFKIAREQAMAMFDNVTIPGYKAQAQYMLGRAWLFDGVRDKHDKLFEAADAAFQAALQLRPNYPDCLYEDGTALAYLKRDDEAVARFRTFLKIAKPNDLNYQRVQRFVDRPELARARIAPNFQVTTLDDQTLTLESLAGKVVLIDFWATWCGPCREALPHIQKIAQRFEGQPFVVLSVSLDSDEGKWKEFTAKNKMTWLQYRDGGFEGKIATLFAVRAIPATFTIDSDGVLEDQHVGDADIEGKLTKLIARAAEVSTHVSTPTLQTRDSGAPTVQP